MGSSSDAGTADDGSLSATNQLEQLKEFEPVGTWCGFECDGAEGRMAREKEVYIGFSERWRNIPKPSIAQVQGKVIAGGLMLIWPCDLIVAASNAQFADNTVAMGVSGALNAAQDAQGRVGAMSTSFALHQLCHAHNMQVYGHAIDPTGIMSDAVRKSSDRFKAPEKR